MGTKKFWPLFWGLHALACLVALVVILIADVILLTFFNPITIGIWAYFSPKSAIRCLKAFHKEPTNGSAWRTTFAVALNVIWVVNAWIFNRSWRLRKIRLEAMHLKGATYEEELKILKESQDKSYLRALIKANVLSERAKLYVWNSYYLWEELLPFIPEVSEKQFNNLLCGCGLAQHSRPDLARDVLFRERNPKHVEKLVELCCLMRSKECYSPDLPNVLNLQASPNVCMLADYIKSAGLSPRLIDLISTSACPEVAKVLKQALKWYAESTIIKETANDMTAWRAYVTKNDIQSDLQALMNVDQYKVYHALGKKLSDQAIVEICEVNKPMALLVVKDLVTDDTAISLRVMVLIQSDPKLALLASTTTN